MRVHCAFAAAALFLAACAAESPSAPGQPEGFLTHAGEMANLPADGNGNKVVIPFSISNTVSCGTEQLTRNIGGWFQLRVFDQSASGLTQLEAWHRTVTFTNASGDSWTFNDVGSTKYWMEDGNLIVENAGRIPGLIIGKWVVDLSTGEVLFSAGNELETPPAMACARLT